jgi:hypothetical protein
VAQRLAIHLYQPQFFVENCKGVAKFLARTMRRRMAGKVEKQPSN